MERASEQTPLDNGTGKDAHSTRCLIKPIPQDVLLNFCRSIKFYNALLAHRIDYAVV